MSASPPQQQQQQQQQFRSKLKSNDFNLNHKNVSKLYDLCIKYLINNLHLIINTKSIENDNKLMLNLNIKLPASICDSILNEYFIYYESKLRIIERKEYNLFNKFNSKLKKRYFMLKKHEQSQQQSLNEDEQLSLIQFRRQIELDFNEIFSSNTLNNNDLNKLIPYYDLLMCFVSHENKTSVSTAVYKQCSRMNTPLNDQLRKLYAKIKQHLNTTGMIPSRLLQILGDRLNKLYDLRLKSNPKHLTDKDIELLCHNQIEYLDICPCVLTNRTIWLINNNLKCLKYLKLQNYCDWMPNNVQIEPVGVECGQLFKCRSESRDCAVNDNIQFLCSYPGIDIDEEDDEIDDDGDENEDEYEHSNDDDDDDEIEDDDEILNEIDNVVDDDIQMNGNENNNDHINYIDDVEDEDDDNEARENDSNDNNESTATAAVAVTGIEQQEEQRQQQDNETASEMQIDTNNTAATSANTVSKSKVKKSSNLLNLSSSSTSSSSSISSITSSASTSSTFSSIASSNNNNNMQSDRFNEHNYKKLLRKCTKIHHKASNSAATSSSLMDVDSEQQQQQQQASCSSGVNDVAASTSSACQASSAISSIIGSTSNVVGAGLTNLTSFTSTNIQAHLSLLKDLLNRKLFRSNSTNASNANNANNTASCNDNTANNRNDRKLAKKIKKCQKFLLNGGKNDEKFKKKYKKYKKKLKKSVSATKTTATASNATATTSSNMSLPLSLLSLLPLWMSKHIDILNKRDLLNDTSDIAATSEEAAAAAAALNEFFLNDQHSSFMNEEEAAKYLLNLELLKKNANNKKVDNYYVDDEDDDDDDDEEEENSNGFKKNGEEKLHFTSTDTDTDDEYLDDENDDTGFRLARKQAINSSTTNTNSSSFNECNNESIKRVSNTITSKIDILEANNCNYTLNKNQFKILNLENLQYLSLKGLDNYLSISILNEMLAKFKQLKYLDLTNCYKRLTLPPTDIIKSTFNGDYELNYKTNLNKTLKHLIFSNFEPDELTFNMKFICNLKQLNYLDLSNYREKDVVNIYKNPSYLLAKLVFYLENLHSLDISGTTLGGPDLFKIDDEIEHIKRKLKNDLDNNIDGLLDDDNDYCRDNNYLNKKLKFLDELNEKTCNQSKIIGLLFLNCIKLNFLGCINCDYNVSARDKIPAMYIAGESKEQYLFTSLEVYIDRPLFILNALNYLFELYRDDMIQDKMYGGHLIMNCMNKYMDNSRIQISASASLFYVLKYSKDENKQLPYFYLKRLIESIINAMEEHIDQNPMRRNFVLIICKLNLPDDVLFVSDRLIHILLKIFDDYIEEKMKPNDRILNNNNNNNNNDRSDNFIIRTSMHLLNTLACSVHGSDKTAVGSLAIPVAMDLIRTKIIQKDPDDILDLTWSFLWNITDETPDNCRIFLDHCDGMSVFMNCIQFKRSEIIRNMMGLLGNVAEVKILRDRLVKNEYIATFRQLLFTHSDSIETNHNDNIEIPYNSAGVLAHIMSDGVDIWTCDAHERDAVIKDLEKAIDIWDIKSERNINYRSFEPIFRLVNEYTNPICQRWSCWALANLTTVYPEIYCPLFIKENGHLLLQPLCENINVNNNIKIYANIVLNNVAKYQQQNQHQQ